MTKHNPVGFEVVSVDADIHLRVSVIHECNLWQNHNVNYLRRVGDGMNSHWQRYPLSGITRYFDSRKFMLHLQDPSKAGMDQITIKYDHLLELTFSLDAVASLAIWIATKKLDDRGHGLLQTMKAIAGDTSVDLPVRSYVEILESKWIAERLNPMHTTVFGAGDSYGLTDLGKEVFKQIEIIEGN